MKTITFLERIRPRAHVRYRALPLFGSIIADYCVWLRQRSYTTKTILVCLKGIRQVEGWLRCEGRRKLADISERDICAVHDRFRANNNVGGAARSLGAFLVERGLIAAAAPPPPMFSQRELAHFGEYLRAVCGFAGATIVRHHGRIRSFLQFLKADRRPSNLRDISIRRIEDYLRLAAKTNTRFSLQQVVASLRTYLRWRYTKGLLRLPLHEQIDSPRCYRLERLPRALPWAQLSALLRSIERTTPMGQRDFTILFLAARYGLRSGELVALKLEDFNWRTGTIRILQSKTKQTLFLPLTDEAGDIVSRYLRDARPVSPHRAVFLRQRAPMGPLLATSVYDILESRVRRSGLPLKTMGTHVLRHSFAVHLLRQGVSTKQIGDAMGHRDIESTGVYLRLAVDDLRLIGLPVPIAGRAATLVPFTWACGLPKVRPEKLPSLRSKKFRGPFALSLSRYVANRRALGRGFNSEARILRQWDDFLVRKRLQRHECEGEAFQQWADELGRLNPTVRRNRLRVVRNFLLFHRRDHPAIWAPDQSLFPRPQPHRAPRIVSPVEMARILATARRLPALNYNPLRAQIIRAAFILLFCCGLRRSELLRLRLRHYDRRERALLIEETKFHKSRVVPLHATVARELERFLACWPSHGQRLDPDCPLIWSGRPTSTGDGMTGTALRQNWLRLCGSAGVLDHHGRPPHLHDLRHSMAVAVLYCGYARGQNPNSLLPYLAAYLGHVSPVSTHHYLHLTPELRQAASQRFHADCAQIFQSGGAT